MVQQIPFGSMLIYGYEHTLKNTTNPIAAKKEQKKPMMGGLGQDTIEFKGPAPAPKPLRASVAHDPTGILNMQNPFD